jgi:hypothetical protein
VIVTNSLTAPVTGGTSGIDGATPTNWPQIGIHVVVVGRVEVRLAGEKANIIASDHRRHIDDHIPGNGSFQFHSVGKTRCRCESHSHLRGVEVDDA